MRDDVLPKMQPETLGDLRAEIDRIDLEMHRLLMKRGDIIDRLIAVKARQGGGSAFRPDREAQMMRALVERHEGLLPLDTVEGVWRIIISTFTYVQANYSVHADDSGGDAAMRDSARFHFGFTVPYVTHHGAGAVVNAVAASQNDLGMVRSTGALCDGAWWTRLVGDDAPKIIARLPFVERPDHPAGLPVFIVAKPLAEAASQDIALHAVALPRWLHSVPAAIGALEGEILASAPANGGLSLLVAAPGEARGEDLARELARAGLERVRVENVGSHAARFELDKAVSGIFAPRS
jgi:chorismate mutase